MYKTTMVDQGKDSEIVSSGFFSAPNENGFCIKRQKSSARSRAQNPSSPQSKVLTSPLGLQDQSVPGPVKLVLFSAQWSSWRYERRVLFCTVA